MKKLPLVSEFMDTEVPTLSPSQGVLDAVDFLLENGVTGAPVVEAGRLVGILTEKDCLEVVAHTEPSKEARRTVADYMSTDVQTVVPSMDVYYAAGLFVRQNFRRFPVVEDGRLVGAVTRFDLLRAIRANRDYWATALVQGPRHSR